MTYFHFVFIFVVYLNCDASRTEFELTLMKTCAMASHFSDDLIDIVLILYTLVECTWRNVTMHLPERSVAKILYYKVPGYIASTLQYILYLYLTIIKENINCITAHYAG